MKDLIKEYCTAYRTKIINYPAPITTTSVISELPQRVAKAVMALATLEHKLADAVGKVDSVIHMRYGSTSLPIHMMAKALDVNEHFVYAYYLEYGGDVGDLISMLGRQPIYYFNLVVDKIELGNAYDIPWELVDAYKNEYDIYRAFVSKYTVGAKNESIYVRKSIVSGQYRELKITAKVQERFDSFEKSILQQLRPAQAEQRYGRRVPIKLRGVSSSEHARQLKESGYED
jgi:hypothetical protein